MLDLPVHHFRAVTHDGQFHADDVLAAAILTLYRADRFGLDTIDLKFATGHHTHTSAVQAFAEGQKRKGTAYACLTDGHIYLPATPIHNTLFAVPRGGGTLPWGKHYIMDYSW